MDRQVKFFQDLEDNWDSIIHKVKPLIEEEFQNWKPDFRIADFKAEFVPTFLNIPILEKKTYEWELTFETDHDQNHIFTVYFENMNPTGVGVDG